MISFCTWLYAKGRLTLGIEAEFLVVVANRPVEQGRDRRPPEAPLGLTNQQA